MIFLLDTQLILWLSSASNRLPAAALELIEQPGNTFYFSTVSIWEVVIKAGQGRADFDFDASILRRQLLANGYVELPLLSKHVLAVGHLPQMHKDPFDRALIAQAQSEQITLLTADATVARYPGTIWKV